MTIVLFNNVSEDKEEAFMKKTVSVIMTICLCMADISMVRSYDESQSVIASRPQITRTGELLSASVLVKNSDSKSAKVKFLAKNGSFVSAELAANEAKRLSLGFNSKNDGYAAAELYCNDKTVTDFVSVNADEEFKVTNTNAADSFVIDSDIVFEYNSTVENFGEIKLFLNNKNVDFVQTAKTVNDKTTLTISPKSDLMTNCKIRLVMPEIKDIFNRTIEAKEYLFNTAKAEDIYEVYQTSVVYSQAGIGGFAVLADFKDNAPKKVYFARTTVVPKVETNLSFMSNAIAMVIDPAGKLAAAYDFSNMPSGKKNIVIDIPYAMEGIWQFKFASGRNGDLLEIGLPEADNWGVRGETALGVTDTTPRESYVYVPEKVNSLYVGASNAGVSAYDTDSTAEMTMQSVNKVFAKYEGTFDNIEEEKIYKLKIPDKYRGLVIVDTAPSLMCPTAEMAQNLKGGWIDVRGVLVQGSTQKALREYLIKYINEHNFDITHEKPEYIRGTLKNPRAEALFFSAGGVISNVKGFSDKQNFNINSPYCGSFVSDETPTWEDGSFVTTHTRAFSGLVNMNGELNAFYHHEGLINRSVISVLASLLMLSEDLVIKDNVQSSSYPITHGNFFYSYTAECYLNIRDLIDEETRRLIDNAIILLSYNQGNMQGLGPTNQWLFTVLGVTCSAYSTGDEIAKGILNNHLEGLVNGPKYSKGQSEAGFFLEGSGCDGEYNNLSCHLFYETYKLIREYDPNNEYLDRLKSMLQKSLEFTSLFLVEDKDSKYFRTNASTSRTLNDNGTDSHKTYTKVMDEFPLAKRRFDLFGSLNTEPKAHNRLFIYVPIYSEFSSREESGSLLEFKAYQSITEDESELLPFEYDEGIWEKPGIIALKHKGLYMNVFYGIPEEKVPNMSFMGGGTTLLWAKGCDTVEASRKHVNYSDITSYDQIIASCVFGKKSNGDVFVTGKEQSEPEWLEEGKSFRIKGITPDGIDVSWTYTLTDEGIEQKVRALGDAEELWLNIPISNVNENAICTYDAGRLNYELNGGSVSFEWDKESEYYVTEIEKVRCLRVKLSSGEAEIKMKCNSYTEPNGVSIERVGAGSEKEIDVSVKNSTNQLKKIQIICAGYSKEDKLDFVSVESQELREGLVKTIALKDKSTKNTEKIKVMVWESLNRMTPFDIYSFNPTS